VRPLDDDEVSIQECLDWQHAYVMAAGSPTAGLILEAIMADLAAGGPLAARLPAITRFGDLTGLRVMAAVHRLAIDRSAPEVALRLPTLGGTPPASTAQRSDFSRAVVRALVDHPEELAASLAHVPQTNEAGRAALLRMALSREDPMRPVRLREIGASAGLNLRADHLPGIPGLERGPLPSIVDRVGCDLHPVDVSTVSGRSLLGSYVWVDDVERFRRLAAAMEVANRVPARLVRADAEEFARSLDLAEGTTTVLWHSAVWVYLPRTTRRAVLDAIGQLGRTATENRPLLHVTWEWDPAVPAQDAFALVVRRWSGRPDDGLPVMVANGMSHGTDVVPCDDVVLAVDPLVMQAG
jgi:hypothetical protein